jgi:hypothetical protein
MDNNLHELSEFLTNSRLKNCGATECKLDSKHSKDRFEKFKCSLSEVVIIKGGKCYDYKSINEGKNEIS